MHHLRPLAIICLLLTAFILSCKKDHPATTAHVQLDSLHINLNFPSSQIGLNQDPLKAYELIISEAGGKVLLDSIMRYNTPILAWIKTNQTLLDITTVRAWASTNSFLIHSYKAIDLTAWVNIPGNDSVQFPSGGVSAPPAITGISTYTHVSVPLGTYYNVLAYGRANDGQVYNNVIYSDYSAPVGEYAYLIFPTLGLYNIHRITGLPDTVDLSKPDSCVSVSFSKSAIYTTAGFSLAGYPDTGDLSHTVNLTYYTQAGTPLTDATSLFYPGTKGFKKYLFSYYLSDGNNNNYASVNLPYIDSIPTNLAIPDPASYNFSLTNDTAVSTNFTHKPTYYEVTSHLGYAQFTLTAPGDSALLHPVAFYRALKSRFLGIQNFSMMQMDNINIVTDAQPEYQAYWVGHTQIYQAWKEPGSAYTTFQRHF